MTRIVPLSHVVAEFESGSRPAGGVSDATGEVLSLGGEHLNDLGGFDLSAPKRVSREYFAGMKRGRVSERDILIVKDGATTGKVSYVPDGFAHLPCAINEHIFRLSVKPGVADAKWVFYCLYSSHGNSEILKDFRGSTIGGITQDVTNKATIPLPPLLEQQRIAGILSRADRLRRLRRYALEMSESYLQSVFLEMFGDPATNPMGWKQAKIGDVVASSQYGTSAKSNRDKRGYPVLGMGNITYSGEIDLTNVAWVDLNFEEFADLRLEPGDIIFNRTNSTELVGKTAQWAYSFDAVIASYLVKLRMSNQVLPSYFVALLNTRYFKLMFQARCLKAVGQSNISPTLLKEFPMLTPPLSMQRDYQEVVDKHKRLRGQQHEALRQAEHLFQTLLHGAFRGEG